MNKTTFFSRVEGNETEARLKVWRKVVNGDGSVEKELVFEESYQAPCNYIVDSTGEQVCEDLSSRGNTLLAKGDVKKVIRGQADRYVSWLREQADVRDGWR